MEIQNKPLPHKYIEKPDWFNESEERKKWWEGRLRIIYFDPCEVYKRAEGFIDPCKRSQSRLTTEILFPKRTDGMCRCGCNKPAKRMWADEYCSTFAYRVYNIICYGTQRARMFIETYYGDKCSVEGCTNKGCDIDHIVPVKHGGGGCWLSNFLPLCHDHHVDKTHKDFGWGKYKNKIDEENETN